MSKYEKLSGKPLDLAEKIDVSKSSWYTSAKAKFKTQAEAINYVKELIKTQDASYRVHSLKGKIRKI